MRYAYERLIIDTLCREVQEETGYLVKRDSIREYMKVMERRKGDPDDLLEMRVTMKLTTLCYIEQDDKYLMLHRIKKENDLNHDKWIGVGGKFEADETPEECLLREVKEETGLTLLKYRARGIITFISDEWETEYMHLFTASEYEGTMIECDEGELVWVPKAEIEDLKLWEGDKIFLRLLNECEAFFSLKLRYEGEKLVESKVNVY